MWGFYRLTVLFIAKINCLKHFSRYGHYEGEVEDIHITVLQLFLKLLCLAAVC